MDKSIVEYEALIPLLLDAKNTWDKLLDFINTHYKITEKWDAKKPTSEYRNELKLQSANKTLITLYLREGYFEANIVFGKGDIEKFETARDTFGTEILELYDSVEICHGQRWLFIEMRDDNLLEDIKNMLLLKKKPNKK